MRKYRLKSGKFFKHTASGLARLVKGDVVELSEAQARSFSDLFEPVDGEPAAEATNDESDGGGDEVSAQPSPWADVQDMTVAEIRELVSEVDSAEDLAEIVDVEKYGKGRKSVFDAVAARAEELRAGDK